MRFFHLSSPHLVTLSSSRTDSCAMKPRPVLIRLLLPFAVTIVLVVIACAIAFYYAGQQNVQIEQKNDLARLAALGARGLTGDSITPDQRKQIQSLADVPIRASRSSTARAAVLLDTQADPVQMEITTPDRRSWRHVPMGLAAAFGTATRSTRRRSMLRRHWIKPNPMASPAFELSAKCLGQSSDVRRGPSSSRQPRQRCCW